MASSSSTTDGDDIITRAIATVLRSPPLSQVLPAWVRLSRPRIWIGAVDAIERCSSKARRSSAKRRLFPGCSRPQCVQRRRAWRAADGLAENPRTGAAGAATLTVPLPLAFRMRLLDVVIFPVTRLGLGLGVLERPSASGDPLARGIQPARSMQCAVDLQQDGHAVPGPAGDPRQAWKRDSRFGQCPGPPSQCGGAAGRMTNSAPGPGEALPSRRPSPPCAMPAISSELMASPGAASSRWPGSGSSSRAGRTCPRRVRCSASGILGPSPVTESCAAQPRRCAGYGKVLPCCGRSAGRCRRGCRPCGRAGNSLPSTTARCRVPAMQGHLLGGRFAAVQSVTTPA